MNATESDRWLGRNAPWLVALAILALIVAALFVFEGTPSGTQPHGSTAGSRNGHAHTRSLAATPRTGRAAATGSAGGPLTLVSSVPAPGAQQVASDATLSVEFSRPVSVGKVTPSLSPQIAGTWVQGGVDSLSYRLDSPFIPGTEETVTVPGGPDGLRAKDGATLASSSSIQFGVAGGDVLRVQQLLAEEDYLPLSFETSGRPPTRAQLARNEPGSFRWRWPTLPSQLTSQWTQGTDNVITTAAIESFQSQNGLGVTGQAGPAFWAALVNDFVNHRNSATPYVYVLVDKVLPENLTLWNNGAAQYVGVPVNTGAPGADTTDGTFTVFEHVRFSDMKGTNPDGTTYNDPNVPYASYFNGGDALHGFIRASYGSPQSNGCVEMSYADAAIVWPLTPVGTLVTIEGPNYGSAPPSTTTTTTAPPPPPPTTTPTTVPPPPPTTAPPPPPTTTTTAPAPPATTTTAAPAPPARPAAGSPGG